MNANVSTATMVPAATRNIPMLLRGDTRGLTDWLTESGSRGLVWCVFVVTVMSGLYGAAIGAWRSPWQAVYTAVKFPLILLLTAAGNALIHSILAPLLGLNLGFKQSLRAVLMSFSLLAVILGGFSPLVLFLIWNFPALDSSLESATVSFSFLKITQVGVIAFAGVAANVRLAHWLHSLCGSKAAAVRVVLAWLAVDLFLGAQLTWILRPLFGSPHFEVEFLRENAFDGNFFETIFHTSSYLLTR